ncbi:MAG: hypothetical protein D6714_16165, partial [Bacteroidetes bacterium]
QSGCPFKSRFQKQVSLETKVVKPLKNNDKHITTPLRQRRNRYGIYTTNSKSNYDINAFCQKKYLIFTGRKNSCGKRFQ